MNNYIRKMTNTNHAICNFTRTNHTDTLGWNVLFHKPAGLIVFEFFLTSSILGSHSIAQCVQEQQVSKLNIKMIHSIPSWLVTCNRKSTEASPAFPGEQDHCSFLANYCCYRIYTPGNSQKENVPTPFNNPSLLNKLKIHGRLNLFWSVP